MSEIYVYLTPGRLLDPTRLTWYQRGLAVAGLNPGIEYCRRCRLFFEKAQVDQPDVISVCPKCQK